MAACDKLITREINGKKYYIKVYIKPDELNKNRIGIYLYREEANAYGEVWMLNTWVELESGFIFKKYMSKDEAKKQTNAAVRRISEFLDVIEKEGDAMRFLGGMQADGFSVNEGLLFPEFRNTGVRASVPGPEYITADDIEVPIVAPSTPSEPPVPDAPVNNTRKYNI